MERLTELLKFRRNSKKIFVKYKDEYLTYEALYEITCKVSENISGKTQSSAVGIFIPNSLNYVVSYFSILSSELTIVPIPFDSTVYEIESTIKYCCLDYLIVDNSCSTILLEQIIQNKSLSFVYNMENDIFQKGDRSYISNNKIVDKELEDVAILLHTSGTTNNPKKVMLTHGNLLANIKSNIESIGFDENDTSLILLPMFFGYCNTAQFLTHFYLGGTIYIYDGIFFPKKVIEIIQNEGVTNFTAVPTMLLLILDFVKKNFQNIKLNTLQYVCFGGGNMPHQKLSELVEYFNDVNFIQTYGQTEASPRVTALLPEYAISKLGSVGKAIPGVQVKVVDDKFDETENGMIGEIVVSGKNIMKGYYKNPNLTKSVLNGNWLKTGDLGYFDSDGFLFLVGRKKNIIISGGKNIYPEEIEEILLDVGYVKKALVYGIEDSLMGEKVVAELVIDGESTRLTEVRDICKKKLSAYKIPSKFILVQSLEQTKTGKIQRKR